MYYFVIVHYKVTTIFANHQIYRHLYFVELTLNKENIPTYLALIDKCQTATELAKVVVEMAEQEPRLTAEEIVKSRFISLLLPLAPKITKGTSIDNVRARINDAWAKRPRHR